MDIDALARRYDADGYISGIPIISGEEATEHRRAMERAEGHIGSLHYRSKAHAFLTSPLHLATHGTALDIVESMIGPDVLLYNVTYIIKEPNSASRDLDPAALAHQKKLEDLHRATAGSN